MKRVIVILLLVLISNTIYGQNVFKFRTTEVSFKFKVDGVWQDWSEWEDTSVLVVLDTQKGRFTVYSSEKQVYDLVEEEGKSINKDNSEIYSVYCVNADGVTCRLQLLTDIDGNTQLYVRFSDAIWVYNLRQI